VGVTKAGIGSFRHTEMLCGQSVSTGGVVSATLMTCEAVELLPQASVAFQVLVHTTGHVPLLVTVEVNVAVPQVSLAVGVVKLGVAGH
jgi:hypothetical protein